MNRVASLCDNVTLSKLRLNVWIWIVLSVKVRTILIVKPFVQRSQDEEEWAECVLNKQELKNCCCLRTLHIEQNISIFSNRATTQCMYHDKYSVRDTSKVSTQFQPMSNPVYFEAFSWWTEPEQVSSGGPSLFSEWKKNAKNYFFSRKNVLIL